jgi:iron-sulfur cluster assembly protein
MAELMTVAGVEVTRLEEDIVITERALQEIKTIKQTNDIQPEMGLRMGVKGGGCSGFTYSLAFDSKRDGDKVIDKGEVNIFVDGKSLFYLAGVQLDFSDGLNGRGFTFNNPNATKTCGCGSSFGV